MHGIIVTCTSSTPLAEVAERMVRQRIHCFVVLQVFGRDDGFELRWGIVSNRDLVEAAAAGDGARTAGEIAASPPVTIDRDESVSRAAQLMAEHKVGPPHGGGRGPGAARGGRLRPRHRPLPRASGRDLREEAVPHSGEFLVPAEVLNRHGAVGLPLGKATPSRDGRGW